MKHVRWVFLGFIFLFISVFGGYFGYGAWLSHNGNEVHPQMKAATVLPVRVRPLEGQMLQMAASDPQGASVAAILAYQYGTLTDTLPFDVYRKIDSAGALRRGAVDWKRVVTAYPKIGYYMLRTFSAHKLDEGMDGGTRPIVQVKDAIGISHWVMLTGSNGASYIAYDPLSPNDITVALGKYNNRIYACRLLYNSAARSYVGE